MVRGYLVRTWVQNLLPSLGSDSFCVCVCARALKFLERGVRWGDTVGRYPALLLLTGLPLLFSHSVVWCMLKLANLCNNLLHLSLICFLQTSLQTVLGYIVWKVTLVWSVIWHDWSCSRYWEIGHWFLLVHSKTWTHCSCIYNSTWSFPYPTWGLSLPLTQDSS